MKQRDADAELEKSENLKCEGGVKTSPTQVSKVCLMGRSKVKFENLIIGSFLALDNAFRAVERCKNSGFHLFFQLP